MNNINEHSNRIHIGDIVSVTSEILDNGYSIKCKVIYMPLSPGDLWIFKSEASGDIIYVPGNCVVRKEIKNESI